MSQRLISHSPDLKRLQDEGYDLDVRSGYLLVNHVPYVNSNRQVEFGILVSELTLSGDVTAPPSTHVAYFVGSHPCDQDGRKLTKIEHQSLSQELAKDLVVQHSFSSKPSQGYQDYYEKIATYVNIISQYAHVLDPSVTVTTFPVIEDGEEEAVFAYVDTASSRAEINVVTDKLRLDKVAIVGLGGTGSYVLDLIAKTPIKQIHLFDGDKFLQHNAFRSPGAASVDELRQAPQKVGYFRERYSRIHRQIVAHNGYLDASNLDQLQGMTFVFLCLDKGEAKRLIASRLEELGIPFIDVGMGVQLVDGQLTGILRVTASTLAYRDSKRRISFGDSAGNNEYSRNIQIADLNALNASLAVIKWKKMFGFYVDLEHEHFSAYTIDGNVMNNEEQG